MNSKDVEGFEENWQEYLQISHFIDEGNPNNEDPEPPGESGKAPEGTRDKALVAVDKATD